jgi:hypothetical protein
MEKVDILIKGVPVPIHNVFKGLCSMSDRSVSDGVIEAMVSFIESSSGGENDTLRNMLEGQRPAPRRR